MQSSIDERENFFEVVIMPRRGRFRGHEAGPAADRMRELAPKFRLARNNAAVAGRGGIEERESADEIVVVDEVSPSGAKRVVASVESLASLKENHPELIIAPLVEYELARTSRPQARAVTVVAAGVGVALRVRVRDRASGAPLAGADVRVFTGWAGRIGDQAVTNAAGIATLALGGNVVFAERIYVYPPLAGFWGTYALDRQLRDQDLFELEPLDLMEPDSLRTLLPVGDGNDGRGVTVAVVDTGVGPHPDVTVLGDDDNGDGHGTHVAGIIGGGGAPPAGLAGIAPGVAIRSYRVFAGNGKAANFDVALAIDQAVADGCDLINLSLVFPGGKADPVVGAAAAEAYRAGVVCIAAAGNEGRKPVSYPARLQKVVGVSATGRRGTYPAGSIDELDELGPNGTDPRDFIAAFSNVGEDLAATAPGVGVVSCVPGGYGWMSGTSMACPAVTGVAARLLAADPATLNGKRASARALKIRRLVERACRSLGFDNELEGEGLPTP